MLYSPTAKRYPRRMFPLLLLAAAAFAAEPVRAPETFTELATGEVGSLDPAFPYDAPSQSVMQNVYETLIAFKGASLSEYEPRLSEKVPSAANGLVTNGGRTYRFPIRKGVKFHDGPRSRRDVRYPAALHSRDRLAARPCSSPSRGCPPRAAPPAP